MENLDDLSDEPSGHKGVVHPDPPMSSCETTLAKARILASLEMRFGVLYLVAYNSWMGLAAWESTN